MSFAQRLTTIMESKGISAYKLSSDIKVISEAMIGKWKNGKSLPSFENIILLSNYLGLTTDYLLTGKETTKENELTQNQKELLDWFNKFSDREQIKILGRLEGIKNFDMETANELNRIQGFSATKLENARVGK